MDERLTDFREARGLTAYRVAKNGDIRTGQVRSVESGDANYTIDIFLGYIKRCDLYIYFAEKSENREKPHVLNNLNNLKA